jgi:hypothetical protein
MSETVPKKHRNKTLEQIEEYRLREAARKAESRSIRDRIETALKELEVDNKEYVVVKKILGTMAESTYRRWLKERNSVPLKKNFTTIQPRHGRSFFEISPTSI